jgi:23S rRNA (guanine2445-N2)-methyltransferase / 23S rRNA (guanine2069-N7)-methyltransferase
MSEAFVCFATCPKGAEELLATELAGVGAGGIRRSRAGSAFTGDLATAYRVCLWSRVASRVLLQLARVDASGPEALYAGVSEIAWEDHVPVDGTLAVDFVTPSPGITDTRYGGQLVKDAVVDRLRDRFGRRPSVDSSAPDVRINVSVRSGRAAVAIDLSGDSLHRRGWRRPGVQTGAPLKENLAGAILLGCGWPQLARDGWGFADPMCGSGTLPIEAALVAADRAPGLLRERWGFSGWLGHDEEAWAELREEALLRAEAGAREVPDIAGSDPDPRALDLARDGAERAGVGSLVRFEQLDVTEARAWAATGLVATNPPYGERLQAGTDLRPLYRALGTTLVARFPGWHVAVLTADQRLAHELGLPAPRTRTLYNGAIECELVLADLPVPQTGPRPLGALAVAGVSDVTGGDVTGGSAAFANRLRKNARRLGKWARKNGIECYRLYDADLPDYAVAIDRYGGSVVIAEYEAPAEIDSTVAARRFAEAVALVPEVLAMEPADVHVKVRRRQRGASQYEPLERAGRFVEVGEGGLAFLVNLTDYLDTGLFLDHRDTRALLREAARDKRFANLFCYTGTATVYAAAGGAAATTSVDLSTTYLDWARRNMECNGLTGPEHAFARADVSTWIAEQPDAAFDLVFCDPPTFSNSARMEGTFDVRRDHQALLGGLRRVIADDGALVFSTNSRSFRLDEREVGAFYEIDDITERTTPEDFARKRPHRCYRLLPKV